MAVAGHLTSPALRQFPLPVTRHPSYSSRAEQPHAERAVPSPLPDITITRELGSLPGWSRRGAVLTKSVTRGSFRAAIEMVRRVADAAESADHHPDIDIR